MQREAGGVETEEKEEEKKVKKRCLGVECKLITWTAVVNYIFFFSMFSNKNERHLAK